PTRLHVHISRHPLCGYVLHCSRGHSSPVRSGQLDETILRKIWVNHIERAGSAVLTTETGALRALSHPLCLEDPPDRTAQP
ncbi:unnamed protein product, partial [Mycena citricolor]